MGTKDIFNILVLVNVACLVMELVLAVGRLKRCRRQRKLKKALVATLTPNCQSRARIEAEWLRAQFPSFVSDEERYDHDRLTRVVAEAQEKDLEGVSDGD